MVQIVRLVGITALTCTQAVGVLSAPVPQIRALDVHNGKPEAHDYHALVRRAKDKLPAAIPTSGGSAFNRYGPRPGGGGQSAQDRPDPTPAGGHLHLMQVITPDGRISMVPFTPDTLDHLPAMGAHAQTPARAAQVAQPAHVTPALFISGQTALARGKMALELAKKHAPGQMPSTSQEVQAPLDRVVPDEMSSTDQPGHSDTHSTSTSRDPTPYSASTPFKFMR
jgi:hypothetical protein